MTAKPFTDAEIAQAVEYYATHGDEYIAQLPSKTALVCAHNNRRWLATLDAMRAYHDEQDQRGGEESPEAIAGAASEESCGPARVGHSHKEPPSPSPVSPDGEVGHLVARGGSTSKPTPEPADDAGAVVDRLTSALDNFIGEVDCHEPPVEWDAETDGAYGDLKAEFERALAAQPEPNADTRPWEDLVAMRAERDDLAAENRELRLALRNARTVIAAALNNCMIGTTAEYVVDRIDAALRGEKEPSDGDK